MRIIIEEPDSGEEDSVIVRVKQLTPDIQRAISILKNPDSLTVFDGEKASRLALAGICYIESVDLKTFLYTDKEVFRSKQKLYEIEELLSGTSFFRAGKALLVNCDKITTVAPDFNGRFTAVMTSGEKVIISRQYVPVMKERFGL
jgi:DNA-binding LytR/AlgR family response regulator